MKFEIRTQINKDNTEMSLFIKEFYTDSEVYKVIWGGIFDISPKSKLSVEEVNQFGNYIAENYKHFHGENNVTFKGC